MDVWDGAHETVINRLQQEGLAAPDGDAGGRLLTFGEIGYSTAAPVRSDDGDTAAPVLKTKKKRSKEPPGPRMTRAEMITILIEETASSAQAATANSTTRPTSSWTTTPPAPTAA